MDSLVFIRMELKETPLKHLIQVNYFSQILSFGDVKEAMEEEGRRDVEMKEEIEG